MLTCRSNHRCSYFHLKKYVHSIHFNQKTILVCLKNTIVKIWSKTDICWHGGNLQMIDDVCWRMKKHKACYYYAAQLNKERRDDGREIWIIFENDFEIVFFILFCWNWTWYILRLHSSISLLEYPASFKISSLRPKGMIMSLAFRRDSLGNFSSNSSTSIELLLENPHPNSRPGPLEHDGLVLITVSYSLMSIVEKRTHLVLSLEVIVVVLSF